MLIKFTYSFVSFVLSLFLYSAYSSHAYALTETSYFNSSVSAKQKYGISIKAPDIAENGQVVSVRVDMFGFEGSDRFVKKLQLFVCHMGFRPIETIEFTRPSSFFHTRIRMNKTDSIYALATLTTGEYVYAKKLTKVTIGGCGGGVSLPYASVADASTPSELSNQHARSWVKSSLPFNATRLITSDSRWLPQKSMRVDVKIAGHRARVLMDMEFYNPFKFQNEGRFQLRLPETATPYYVAFGDVVVMDKAQSYQYLPNPKTSGFTQQELQFDRYQHPAKLKEAVMVPRQTARNAYNAIVGKRRDPALVEWQGNGVYSLNVFPLQAYSSHRVVIGYDMDLQRLQNFLDYSFNAPDADIPVDVYVHIEANTAKHIHNLNAIPVLASRGESRLYHFKPKAGELIQIQFKDQPNQYLHGQDQKTGDYFSLKMQLRLPRQFAQKSNSNAIFALDTSATLRGNYYAMQIDTVRNILEKNSDDIKQFAILFFDVGTHWWQTKFVNNTHANRNAFYQYASRINLAGATDLHRALGELAKPSWYHEETFDNWDVFLFSDGFATWGDTRPTALVNNLKKSQHIAQLFAYVARTQPSDRDLLELLVNEAHGAILELPVPYTMTKTDMQHAYRAHRLRNWRVISAQVNGAKDIFTANTQYYTYANNEIHFVGRGQPRADLQIRLQSGDEIRELDAKLPEQVIETELTARIYAEAAVRKLEDSTDQYHDLTLAYASHFRIPRQTVSLLMLESEKDYQQFEINSTSDYANYVVTHPVAEIINSLKAPQTRYAHSYSLPELPKSKLDILAQMHSGFSICKIPYNYLASLGLDSLSYSKPLQHQPLMLTKKAMRGAATKLYINTMSEYDRDTIFAQASRLTGNQLKQSRLRLVSSILESQQSPFEDRLRVVKELLALGLGNESYFLLSMTPSIYGTQGSFELFVQSVALQDEPEYVAALRSLSRLNLEFNKQALEP